eukprot:CAMPEP_0171959400 /NCGR_PEP_ID=MMETSP0993-20121228/147698_1 /TAXON_ID=483369 /ORGANISM="non described non described, Strain CCMP2098" /LENGTH=98 /DNA_ID=CAMNT_0012606901 /DNA_START=232 /DNA_END=529 /DNA_ORIENTATION=-
MGLESLFWVIDAGLLVPVLHVVDHPPPLLGRREKKEVTSHLATIAAASASTEEGPPPQRLLFRAVCAAFCALSPPMVNAFRALACPTPIIAFTEALIH